MARFVLLLCFVISTAAATTPVINETDDSVVPTVPVTSVPRRCPPNEELKLRGACPPDSCDMLYLSVLCIANQTQELLCTCKPGYLRRNTTCVPVDRCLPPECADDPNAIRGCGNRCGKTCADYNTSKVCNNNVCHINGCDCKDGLVYDQNTKRCVKPEQCTKQCQGSHEIYIDCPAGQCNAKTCDDLVNPPGCPRIIPPCPGGCVCEDGYLRDKDGKCISKEQCPINCTKEHEVYFNCLAGQCGPKKCDDLGRSLPCPGPGRSPCPGGCICEQGYLRDVNGNCIKIENCPPKPCGGNQTWMSPCDRPCPYPRCPRDDKPPPPCVNIEPCYPGCQCKLNYLRNSRGECILAPDCPPVNCTRPNEMWDGCPSACLAEGCDNINNQPTTCNTLIWLCSPRCVCKKGHFRNKDGICIPASQCPKQCTGSHEIYIACPAGQCNAKTCDDLVNPPACPRIIPPCPGGCVCEDGYLRDKNGKCIPKGQCHTTCIDNEVYECRSKYEWENCEDRYNSPPFNPGTPADQVCRCYCQSGTWRYNGKCVLPQNCPQ